MDKKFKFSDQPTSAKIAYSVVVAILAISAIVVGMVSANQADKAPIDDSLPPISDNTPNDTTSDKNNSTEPEDDDSKKEEEKPSALIFTSPVSGTVMKGHSVDTPVFSQTLGDWRVHTGLDISAELGSDVLAVAGGEVTAVRSDHFFGKTIEITHDGGIVSVYSNLSNDGVTVKVGDKVKSGDKIGVVGDTSLTELADESHLHFEILVSGVSVNPLDYISDESKKADLGIE